MEHELYLHIKFIILLHYYYTEASTNLNIVNF
jgi:hypothetical protein